MNIALNPWGDNDLVVNGNKGRMGTKEKNTYKNIIVILCIHDNMNCSSALTCF